MIPLSAPCGLPHSWPPYSLSLLKAVGYVFLSTDIFLRLNALPKAGVDAAARSSVSSAFFVSPISNVFIYLSFNLLLSFREVNSFPALFVY